ncbi:MAG: PEP-CTERM sorting domain-containing protein [Duganella sp.]
MNQIIKHVALCSSAALIMCASQAARADTFTYEFSWTGSSPYSAPGYSPYGDSNASAFATVVVQQEIFGNPTMDQISEVSMTVQNANVGNGTFTKDDFSSIDIGYRFLPNLTLGEKYQLSSYDITRVFFFNNGGAAPYNFAEDAMWAGGLQGANALYRGSMFVTRTSVTAVPEPETYAMLFAGLSIVGFAARRSRRKGSQQ